MINNITAPVDGKTHLTSKELDEQNIININYWIDIDSQEAKVNDEDRALTKKMIRIGQEDGWMITDNLGRLWGYDKNKNQYFPFHFEIGNKLIGYCIKKSAAN